MIITLTKEDYLSTMKGEMVNITQTAEPLIDIWAYVEELVHEDVVNKVILENYLVEKVYRNSDNTYHHVLLPTSDENCFVVILVNLINRNINGHYHLDLNPEYGLT